MTAVASDDVADSGRRPIRIGISACLLGHEVRFDGGHKRDIFLTDTFGRFVEWVSVCPEVECGLGTPRESMRLVRVEQGVRLLTVKSGIDVTRQMERFARSRVPALVAEDLSGFVLKKDSPSCGLERVKVYDRPGLLHVAAAAYLQRRSAPRFRTCPWSATHDVSSLRAQIRGCLSSRTDLPATAPEGVNASQSRMTVTLNCRVNRLGRAFVCSDQSSIVRRSIPIRRSMAWQTEPRVDRPRERTFVRQQDRLRCDGCSGQPAVD